MRKGNKRIAAVARTVQQRRPAHLPFGGTEYRLPILERTKSGNFVQTPILGIQYAVVTSAGGYGIRVLAIRKRRVGAAHSGVAESDSIHGDFYSEDLTSSCGEYRWL